MQIDAAIELVQVGVGWLVETHHGTPWAWVRELEARIVVGRRAPWPLFEDAAIDAIAGLNSGPQRHVPEFNPALPEADFGARGFVLNRAFGWLDLLSRLNGLSSLQTFADLRPVPGGMRKWLKKLEKSPPEKVWNQLAKARDKESGQ